MPEDNLLIQTNALVKIYGSELRALDGIDLAIREGEFVAVMGPSGSGKSTLLNLLGALDRPTSGEVIIDGERISQLRDQDLYRSQTVGFVFQLHNLLPTLNTLVSRHFPYLLSCAYLHITSLGNRLGVAHIARSLGRCNLSSFSLLLFDSFVLLQSELYDV